MKAAAKGWERENEMRSRKIELRLRRRRRRDISDGGRGKRGFPSCFSPLFFSSSQIEDTGDEEAAVHLVPPPSTYSCIIPKYSSSSSCFLRAWQFISCVGRLPTSVQIPFFHLAPLVLAVSPSVRIIGSPKTGLKKMGRELGSVLGSREGETRWGSLKEGGGGSRKVGNF